jgi:hypothetical protein
MTMRTSQNTRKKVSSSRIPKPAVTSRIEKRKVLLKIVRDPQPRRFAEFSDEAAEFLEECDYTD